MPVYPTKSSSGGYGPQYAYPTQVPQQYAQQQPGPYYSQQYGHYNY